MNYTISLLLVIVFFIITMMMSIKGFAMTGRQAFASMNKQKGAIARMMSTSGGNVPTDSRDQAFYTLGINVAMQVGTDLKNILSSDEIALVARGFSDSMNGKVADEMTLLRANGPKINEILQSRVSNQLNDEKKKGEDFATKYLLSNPRATKTASGLIYHEVIAGIGKQPNINSKVTVHYHGTLPDGKVFDSSVDRKEPISFPLANVIKGWQEGVALMKVGGKSTLVVPSDLAYGDQGSPPVIPPGATLRFDVELIEVN